MGCYTRTRQGSPEKQNQWGVKRCPQEEACHRNRLAHLWPRSPLMCCPQAGDPGKPRCDVSESNGLSTRGRRCKSRVRKPKTQEMEPRRPREDGCLSSRRTSESSLPEPLCPVRALAGLDDPQPTGGGGLFTRSAGSSASLPDTPRIELRHLPVPA